MERDEIISVLKDYFYKKNMQFNIDMVFLYGSWARGYPKEESDIDLAILFSANINQDYKRFSLITDISYELMGRVKKEVNIISIAEDFPHPMLYYNAIVFSIPVFIKDWDGYLSLKLEAISQMEDFQVFGTKWQYELAQRSLGR